MLEDLLKQNKTYLIAFVCVILCVSLAVRLVQRVLKNPSTVVEDSHVIESPEASKQQDKKSFILVHISGSVKNRGVYKIQSGSRVKDIIESAGGLLRNSDVSSINLSQTLKDGQKIEVPQVIVVSGAPKSTGKLIDINSASESELDAISGVGPATAKKIIEYRTKNGAFKSIDDLKKIKGFGKNKIEKIKAEIML